MRQRTLRARPPFRLLALLLVTAPATEAQEASGIRFFGDFRLRGAADFDRTGRDDRARGRFRFRFGAESEVLNGLVVGGRLVTTPNVNDPNSPYIDMGRGFTRADFTLDRAYLRWRVPIETSLTLWGGKFQNPFATPVIYPEMVWDADINPEGVAAVFQPHPTLRFVAGQYLLFVRAGGRSAGHTALQGLWDGHVGNSLSARAALGAYIYERPDAADGEILARENQGNALAVGAPSDTVGFLSRFAVLHAFGTVTYEDWEVPVTLSGEFMANPRAVDGLDDDGFTAGIQVGRLADARSWRLYYQYQEIGQEALFSPFVQDDFQNGTNMRGHMAGVGYRIRRGMDVHLWTLWSATAEPEVNQLQKRFRLDFTVGF